MAPPKYTPEQRIAAFWSKVNKNGSVPQHRPELGQCWEWIAGKNQDGYGEFSVEKKLTRANRYSWIMTNGEIEGDLCVLHCCDNPSCVNPSHLFLGTKGQNNKDRHAKGRTNVPKGEANGRSKFTRELIEYVRRCYSQGNITQRELAREIGTSQGWISEIINYNHWK